MPNTGHTTALLQPLMFLSSALILNLTGMTSYQS
jgi:hypothetical protein